MWNVLRQWLYVNTDRLALSVSLGLELLSLLLLPLLLFTATAAAAAAAVVADFNHYHNYHNYNKDWVVKMHSAKGLSGCRLMKSQYDTITKQSEISNQVQMLSLCKNNLQKN